MASNNQIVGWLLIILGALLLLGWLDIPYLTEIIAIALIIVGILILIKSIGGPTWLAIVLIVLGAVVLLKGLPFMSDIGHTLGAVIDTIVAVLCIVVGALKVMNKM